MVDRGKRCRRYVFDNKNNSQSTLIKYMKYMYNETDITIRNMTSY